MDAATPPSRLPEPGFYYHFKHDPAGPLNNYAYEVLGVAHHTEDDCRPQDVYMVVYRPLYDTAFVYQHGKMFDVRPLGMFLEDVQKGDAPPVPRFHRIMNPEIIAELVKLRKEMYGA